MERATALHRMRFTVLGLAASNLLVRGTYITMVDDGNELLCSDGFGISQCAVGALTSAVNYLILWAWLPLRRFEFPTSKTMAGVVVNGLIWSCLITDFVSLFLFRSSLASYSTGIADIRGAEFHLMGNIRGAEVELGTKLTILFAIGCCMGTMRFPYSWEVRQIDLVRIILLLLAVYTSAANVAHHVCYSGKVVQHDFDWKPTPQMSFSQRAKSTSESFTTWKRATSTSESLIFLWSDGLPAREFSKLPNVPPTSKRYGATFHQKVDQIMSNQNCTYFEHHHTTSTCTIDAMSHIFHGYQNRRDNYDLYNPYPLAALRAAGYEIANWVQGGLGPVTVQKYFTKWVTKLDSDGIEEDFIQWVKNVKTPFVAFVGFEDTHLLYGFSADFEKNGLRFFQRVERIMKAATDHNPLVFISADHGAIAPNMSPVPDDRIRGHGIMVHGHEGNELVSNVPLWVCPSENRPEQMRIVKAGMKQPITKHVDFMPTLLSHVNLRPVLDPKNWSGGTPWFRERQKPHEKMVLSRFTEGSFDTFAITNRCGYVTLREYEMKEFMLSGVGAEIDQGRRRSHWPWACDDPTLDMRRIPSRLLWDHVRHEFANVVFQRNSAFGEAGF